ncbi:MAG: hypothetical protein IJY27_03495 [Clostridia bacterium]|nr:hypothetical protein [Clostridia bacterium]
MKKLTAILWGIVLIVLGVAFALSALNIIEFDIFFKGWWTLFIIIPCTIGLITERDKTGNLIGLCIGVLLLLGCRDILSFDILWKLAIPAIIVIIGIKLIINATTGSKNSEVKKKNIENGGKMPSYCSTFSGQDVNFDGEIFTGCELTAVFGGIKCDIRHARIDQDVVIEVSAIFGGIDILLPDYVNVKVNSTSIFGGISSEAHKNSSENAVTVYITGACIFGGTDIK